MAYSLQFHDTFIAMIKISGSESFTRWLVSLPVSLPVSPPVSLPVSPPVSHWVVVQFAGGGDTSPL